MGGPMMTEAQRKAMEQRTAMEWLDGYVKGELVHLNREAAATLKDMLERPVLPEASNGDPDYEDAVLAVMHGANLNDITARSAYRALYAHLSAPKTKEVEVESWQVIDGKGCFRGVPPADEEAAGRRRDHLERACPEDRPYTVVRLTGKATVKA
jgi:hypothetical protein